MSEYKNTKKIIVCAMKKWKKRKGNMIKNIILNYKQIETSIVN
ncbi:hypothetical protein [Clostridium saccharoperbutylacetonicum]